MNKVPKQRLKYRNLKLIFYKLAQSKFPLNQARSALFNTIGTLIRIFSFICRTFIRQELANIVREIYLVSYHHTSKHTYGTYCTYYMYVSIFNEYIIY